MLMFIGACAGSTGGGMKVSRLLILAKTLAKELKTALHPQVVAPARMDGKLLNHETRADVIKGSGYSGKIRHHIKAVQADEEKRARKNKDIRRHKHIGGADGLVFQQLAVHAARDRQNIISEHRSVYERTGVLFL